MGSSSESIAGPRSAVTPRPVTPTMARGQRRDDDGSGRVTDAASPAGRLVSDAAATAPVAFVCNKSAAAAAAAAAVVAANGRRVDGIATASRLVAVARGWWDV